MRSDTDRKIGVVYYKHRRFTCANQAAHELIGLDLNQHIGHSISLAFKEVARKVISFKNPANCVYE